jgi:hypothetical protein
MKGILFKDYHDYVKGVSRRLKQASVAPVLQQIFRLNICAVAISIRIKGRVGSPPNAGSTTGDVCVLSATELAPTFEHHGTHLEIRKRPSLALYHYLIHPELVDVRP